MDSGAFLKDKSLKPKEKTEQLAEGLKNRAVSPAEILLFMQTAKATDAATCMEAFEHATLANPSFGGEDLFTFALGALQNKAPRLKWEAARVIGNTASAHPLLLPKAMAALQKTAKDEGTVVRWSAAFALTQIFATPACNTPENSAILQKLCDEEEKASIQKIYQKALKAKK